MNRCEGPECRVILRAGNTTGICGACQKKMDEGRMQRRESVARRQEFEEAKYAKGVKKRPAHVRQVLRATNFFFGFLDKMDDEDGVPFAKEVAIFLLKTDFSMCSKFIARDLDLECQVVERSYNNVRSMAESSPEFRRNLEQVRTQYKREGPA